MTTELIESFPYPDATMEATCEDAAEEIRDLNYTRVKLTIAIRVEIGKRLNHVAATLPHGQLGPWLKHNFSDWSEESTRRWRRMAQELDDYVDPPKLLESLHKFESTTAAEKFVSLPESVQQQVVNAEAFTRKKFEAVYWRATMTERLEDGGLDENNRYGHVLHAIDEVLHNETASEPLKAAAQELYREHEPTFARLADREPAELAVETGIEWKEPDGDRPSAQLDELDNGQHWYMEWTGAGPFPLAALERLGFTNITRVGSRLLMWNGAGEPSVLAAFPRTTDGPAAVSWQKAGVDAVCKRLNASTLESRYGKAL